MKRVGILTFSNTVNYGASLQAYALRSVIESLGCECEILNYSNRELDERETGIRFTLSPSGVARYFLRSGFERRRLDSFARFAEHNLNRTGKLDKRALVAEAKALDHVFIGSDQVFNPRVNGHDSTFFGEGIDKVTPLSAYAASLGDATVESIEACDKDFAKRLASFVGLSVRESNSLTVLREVGLDSTCMPDPTLLLAEDDWAAISSEEGLTSLPASYVLLYTLNSEKKLLDKAFEIAERINVPIVCLHYNTKKFKGVINMRDIGPGAFLTLMRNAAFVCTDSFHGACFSFNFNKPFVVKTSDAAVQSNVRITDFLAHYQIEGSLLDDSSPESPKVDYGQANSILACDRGAAGAYIARCLGL